jgi:hypothetical protein
MILDHRTYTVKHGLMEDYLLRFERDGLPIQLRHLGNYIGSFKSDIGPQNQVVHIWAYEDIADRETRRAAMLADPDWQAFLIANRGTFSEQENKILKPTAFSALR